MPLIDCLTKVNVPEGIRNYILSKKELHIKNGLDESAAERQAINDFKNETVNNLADLHKQVGNNKFEKKSLLHPFHENNGNKIVNENGTPLTVFHGSLGKVSEFDENKIGTNDKGFYGKGIYFTPHEGQAEMYAMKNKENVGAYHINIKNPLIVDVTDMKYEGKDIPKGYDGVIITSEGHPYELVVKDKSQIIKATNESVNKNVSNSDVDTMIKKSKQNAVQEPSTSSLLQHPQETIGETGSGRSGMEPSIEGNEPPTEGEGKTTNKEEIRPTYVQRPPTSLSYMGTDKIETEFGTVPRTPTETKHDINTVKEADNLLEKGWNVQDAIKKIEGGDLHISDAEYVNFTRYAAELSKRLRETNIDAPEYNKTINELNRVTKAADLSGQQQGRALGIRGRFKTVSDGTYENFMLNELTANNEADLTDNQKKTATDQFNKLQEDKATFEDKFSELEKKTSEDKASKEFESAKKSASKTTKKTHEDFVKERKDAVEKAREALKKLRTGESGLSAVPLPGVRELIAIAPHVKKALTSLVEEGAIKLADAVKQLHEDFKELVEGLSEKNIHDIIAGEYNEKNITKKEAAIRQENLRIEAVLINKLEKLQNGEEPRNEKLKIRRNQEIEALQKRIKDFKKENPDKEAQLKQLKSKNESETAKIKEKISKGDFAPEVKKTPILQDKEVQKKYPELFKAAQKSRDELIKTKQDIELRRLRQMYENRSDKQKVIDQLTRIANVPRTLMASMDFSAPLRQALIATVTHPMLAKKAARFMFQATKDEKIYNRWLEDVHTNPRWEGAKKAGLAITDPATLHLKEKEEAFLGSSLAEKIPVAGALVKGSERAYVGYLNKIRWDLYNQYANAFENKGQTPENNPELYKGIASYVNSATGRGGMSFAESASPIMSSVLFSPRLIASRMNMLGLSDIPNALTKIFSLGKGGLDYGFYSQLPKEIRIVAVKDMLKFIAVGTTTLALAKYFANTEVETDPRSTDFGKIKSGNTRWDIWGGFQPYVRLISQLISGQRKSTNTGKMYSLEGGGAFGQDRGDQLLTFGRGKLAPIPSFLWDVIKGRTAAGQKVDRGFDIPFYSGDDMPNEITITDEIGQHVFPLLFQDVIQAMQDKGISALFTAGIPSTFGVGVQTYNQSKGSGGGAGATGTMPHPIKNKSVHPPHPKGGG